MWSAFFTSLREDNVEYFSKCGYDVNMFERPPERYRTKELRDFYFFVLRILSQSEIWIKHKKNEVVKDRSLGLLSCLFCEGNEIPKVLLWWIAQGNKFDNRTYVITRILLKKGVPYKTLIDTFGVDSVPLENGHQLDMALKNGRKITRDEFNWFCATLNESCITICLAHFAKFDTGFIMYDRWVEILKKHNKFDFYQYYFLSLCEK